MSISNPLEELEYEVNHMRLFSKIGDSAKLTDKEIEAFKKTLNFVEPFAHQGRYIITDIKFRFIEAAFCGI